MSIFSRPVLWALALATSVTGHGHVQTVIINGVAYPGYDSPTFPYLSNPPNVFGWTIDQKDNGFVEPVAAGSADIICHRQAVPAKSHVEVKAGDTIFLQWDTWPESHKGPVLDYLANCNGPCESVNKQSLEFFKIGNAGLMRNNYYAADQLIDSGFAWSVKIPSNIAAGNYVLRHEIIALHSAGQPNGAQFYPQCFNLKVTGGGSDRPSGTRGTSLYRSNDPGVLFDLYSNQGSYPIPGPALAAGGTSWVPQTKTQARSTSTATPAGGNDGGSQPTTTSKAPQQSNNPGNPSNPGNGGSCAKMYEQCGGSGFNGPTCCSSGSCRATNEWYSQCL